MKDDSAPFSNNTPESKKRKPDRLVLTDFANGFDPFRNSEGTPHCYQVVIHFDKHGLGCACTNKIDTFIDLLDLDFGWRRWSRLHHFQAFGQDS